MILAIGPLWRGSNAGGLFRALSRQGCLIDIIDEFYFISLRSKNKITKIFERAIRNMQFNEYNNEIIKHINLFLPDILLVYKGAFVFPETLKYAKSKNCKLVLFYPDVSMTAHGDFLPHCIPMYDLIFTTKTFGINDLKNKFNVQNAVFIPHGFDPEIHRKLDISEGYQQMLGCDVSFIGTWSPKKEEWLTYLKTKLPNINLKIWGNSWLVNNNTLNSSIQRREILGDLYALAIQCSKINLGLLSERVSGASSGDLITSRTFHIPGSSGFLLHERNEESILYFDENIDAAFFESKVEMVEKVQYFLNNEEEREKIRQVGFEKTIKNYSLDNRARFILETLKTI